MTATATLDIEGRVATLTLHREEKRNALSIDLLDALHERVAELKAHPDASVCVLTGAGKSFCAGMDLKAILDTPGAAKVLLESIAEITIELRELPMVVIGRVNGAAIGGGCGLVAVCDIAVTHPEAKLGYPEVDLGVCPAVVAPWLVEAIGAGMARRVLLQGGVMSGERAFELGLVSHLVPKDELDDTVAAIANKLAAAGPDALAATKGLLNRLGGEELYANVRKGAAISAAVVEGEEAQTRLRAR